MGWPRTAEVTSAGINSRQPGGTLLSIPLQAAAASGPGALWQSQPPGGSSQHPCPLGSSGPVSPTPAMTQPNSPPLSQQSSCSPAPPGDSPCPDQPFIPDHTASSWKATLTVSCKTKPPAPHTCLLLPLGHPSRETSGPHSLNWCPRNEGREDTRLPLPRGAVGPETW